MEDVWIQTECLCDKNYRLQMCCGVSGPKRLEDTLWKSEEKEGKEEGRDGEKLLMEEKAVSYSLLLPHRAEC